MSFSSGVTVKGYLPYRQMICQLRRMEKEIYHLKNAPTASEPTQISQIEDSLNTMKELLFAKSEELNLRLRCYHDFQLSQSKTYSLPVGDSKADLRQVLPCALPKIFL